MRAFESVCWFCGLLSATRLRGFDVSWQVGGSIFVKVTTGDEVLKSKFSFLAFHSHSLGGQHDASTDFCGTISAP